MNKKLLLAIEKELDTRDKRFMFLKLEFPSLVLYAKLEGNIAECAASIYNEFGRLNKLEKLQSVFETKFDYKFD